MEPNPNAFFGPDGRWYDITALPKHILKIGNRLYFKTDGVAVFEVVIAEGKLPQHVYDWSVPRIATPLSGPS